MVRRSLKWGRPIPLGMLAGVPWTLTPSTCSGILFVRVSLDSRRAVLSVHVCISVVCSETFISYLPQLRCLL